jgi:low temperature requirement protein LtrA
MSGRDPNERHRAATPLELLYDLTFVVAFGVAANSLRTCSPKAILRPGSGLRLDNLRDLLGVD